MLDYDEHREIIRRKKFQEHNEKLKGKVAMEMIDKNEMLANAKIDVFASLAKAIRLNKDLPDKVDMLAETIILLAKENENGN